jgi:ethanolamine utilization protein EutA (predicted chaperonin)
LRPEERPQALVFQQNIGQIVGKVLAGDFHVPCIDEVSLSELDFIDIGRPVDSQSFVPVVIKSLAFGA